MRALRRAPRATRQKAHRWIYDCVKAGTLSVAGYRSGMVVLECSGCRRTFWFSPDDAVQVGAP